MSSGHPHYMQPHVQPLLYRLALNVLEPDDLSAVQAMLDQHFGFGVFPSLDQVPAEARHGHVAITSVWGSEADALRSHGFVILHVLPQPTSVQNSLIGDVPLEIGDFVMAMRGDVPAEMFMKGILLAIEDEVLTS